MNSSLLQKLSMVHFWILYVYYSVIMASLLPAGMQAKA